MTSTAKRLSGRSPKIMVTTTPIRPIPTEYPPFGSLSVVCALKRAGYNDVEFFDIDGLRPSYEDTLDHIIKQKPDILGVSAVVSTAYWFTKRLTLDLKKHLPDTTILLGGNLGASAEVILRKTGVDFVAIGEGERVSVEFAAAYKTGRDKNEFAEVPGLVYLDGDRLVNTGYVQPVEKENLYDIDWRILEENSDIEIFFPKVTGSVLAASTFRYDPRSTEPRRSGKTMATLVASKGCVARCTFCHRWDKGIRYIPVPILMQRLQHIIDHYNVGFVIFGDENFGTDHKWLGEFCDEIEKFDVLWRVSGMRVNRISPEYLKRMKEAGCSAVYFGMETGSRKMLEIMEKKVQIEDNYNAMKWIVDAGLHTTIQLVLGMPGESGETVRETGDFVNYATSLSPEFNPLDLSINYAQALPGTPLYEFGRHHDLIGTSIDEEEKYLLQISDRDASDESTTLNFTGLPRAITESWRPQLIAGAAAKFIAKFGREAYNRHLLKSHYFSTVSAETEKMAGEQTLQDGQDTGYFNYPKEKVDVRGVTESTQEAWEPVRVTDNRLPGFWPLVAARKWRVVLVCYPQLFHSMRKLLPLMVIAFDAQRNGVRYAAGVTGEYFLYLAKQLTSGGQGRTLESKSLRKIVSENLPPIADDKPEMLPLRQGR